MGIEPPSRMKTGSLPNTSFSADAAAWDRTAFADEDRLSPKHLLQCGRRCLHGRRIYRDYHCLATMYFMYRDLYIFGSDFFYMLFKERKYFICLQVRREAQADLCFANRRDH